ncbi:DUF2164 family protein [Exiguobacterium undae]|uniref:DUF2164 family protein n=1 Tax=Exiguobacterium undae TaxID=169177 RepID=UPI00047EAF43|nr:DUF2164 family protein [Exiguobacterium undae]
MFDRFNKEQHQQIIQSIQDFFLEERDEELSEFSADRVFDFIKTSVAVHFYNIGIQDAHAAVLNQFSSLDDELLTLERPVSK